MEMELQSITKKHFIFLNLELSKIVLQVWLIMLEKGLGVPQNHEKATKYIKMAADVSNRPDLINKYAVRFIEGQYCQANYEESIEYLKNGVEKENGDSMAHLGNLYALKIKNTKEAEKYFMMGCET